MSCKSIVLRHSLLALLSVCVKHAARIYAICMDSMTCRTGILSLRCEVKLKGTVLRGSKAFSRVYDLLTDEA